VAELVDHRPRRAPRPYHHGASACRVEPDACKRARETLPVRVVAHQMATHIVDGIHGANCSRLRRNLVNERQCAFLVRDRQVDAHDAEGPYARYGRSQVLRSHRKRDV
jgi:hypothetical protein